MTPPRCTGIGCSNPVKPKASSHRTKRGDRLIDGIKWCWFCSQRCCCREQGLRSAREGRIQQMWTKVGPMREAHGQVTRRARMALYAEDLTTLKRYGVPSDLAVAILERVHLRGDKAGYARAYYQLVSKAKGRAA
jgi:hypothetical protein